MDKILTNHSEKWDKYFYDMTQVVKKQTECLVGGVGAVIVMDGKYVVATGYNGPPTGFVKLDSYDWHREIKSFVSKEDMLKLNDKNPIDKPQCIRRVLGYGSGEMRHYCPCACAERNAISQAARLGNKILGSTLYLNDKEPCLWCAQSIIMAGINEVVVPKKMSKKDMDNTDGLSGAKLLDIADIIYREYIF